MKDSQRIADALAVALGRARELGSGLTVVGYGVAVLTGPTGELKHVEPFANLVTDAGDAYYAAKAITDVGPANPSAPTAADGMKLGTGEDAVTKNGTGAALVTYKTGSNVPFDSGFPQTEDLGGGNGDNAVYESTWEAGVATDSALAEVVIVTDADTDATSAEGDTYSRALFSSPIDKGSGDSLAVTWKHKFLGA